MQAVTTGNGEIARRRADAIPRGVGCVHPIAIARAHGALLWDVDGNEYIDFIGGIGVLNAGHTNAAIVEAIAEQARRYTHLSFQVTSYEPYVELAEALNALAPGPSKKKTLLLNSGSEAIENAVKIARAYTGRPAVIAFQHGYHGRTLLALGMTGKNDPYKQNFGPFPSDVFHAPYPHEASGWTLARTLEALDELFASSASPDRVCAIVIEPVLGEGGFIAAPPMFLRALREVCDRYGIVLICDEIQSGFGRTGTFFAVDHARIEPDLITIAKSLAGGTPLSAVIGKSEIMDAPAPGGLGGTYAGNPLACAAALATLRLMDEAFLSHAVAIGATIRTAFESLRAQFPDAIGEIRGLGAMIGLEFRHGSGVVSSIIASARARGLLLMPAGGGNVIRCLVPLVIDDDTLAEALQRFADACTSVLTTEVKQNS